MEIYEGTGLWYADWAIKKQVKKCQGALKIVRYVNILNIQLVAKKKLKEEKNKAPKRRIMKVTYILTVLFL
jgi:hypothetical protein